MENNLPMLDDIVLQALDFFEKNIPSAFNPKKYNLPFVIGSGNAYNTGQILFSHQAAVYADESNCMTLLRSYKHVINKGLMHDAIIISASGEKDSVWEVEHAKKCGLKTTLLTTKKNSSAAKIADHVITFKSIAEPYTYNTSTYLGMLLSATKEHAQYITEFIESLYLPDNFKSYASYAFILPDAFSKVCPMLDIKKDELFGPYVSLRSFSEGQARHAKFIHQCESELVISCTGKNDYYGDPHHRFTFSLPDKMYSAGIMALTYYLVGKIQRSKPDYFREHIKQYVTDYGPKAYGNTIPFDLIVPGSS